MSASDDSDRSHDDKAATSAPVTRGRTSRMPKTRKRTSRARRNTTSTLRGDTETVLTDVVAIETGLCKYPTMTGYAEQLALAASDIHARRASRFCFVPTARRRAELRARAAHLRTLAQAPQGTPEWFAYRRGAPGADGVYRGGRLTASDTGTVLGLNEYACEDEVLIKKAGHDTFNWSPACEHGKKYEDVSLAIFRARTGRVVHEYGCIPDDRQPHVAASPDGITECGDAVEIKNPSSRTITGVPKPVYYAQMQQQLAVLDLELCHFVETKIREYDGPTAFADDAPSDDPEAGWTADGHEKGVLLELVEVPPEERGRDEVWGRRARANAGPPRATYRYAPLGLGPSACRAWVDREVESVDPDAFRIYVRYWRCAVYSCVPVYRDREWWARQQPALDAFWRRVQEVRASPELQAACKRRYDDFTAAKEARFGRSRRGGGGGGGVRQVTLALGSDAAAAAATPSEVAAARQRAADHLFGEDPDRR